MEARCKDVRGDSVELNRHLSMHQQLGVTASGFAYSFSGVDMMALCVFLRKGSSLLRDSLHILQKASAVLAVM